LADHKGEGVLTSCARILAKRPLCDRCLGRQFHLLDETEDNSIIGASLKLALYLEHSSSYQEGKVKSLRILRRLASSGHRPSMVFVRAHTGKEVEEEPCPICGSAIFNKLGDLAKRAAAELHEYEHETFQVGSRLPRRVFKLDDEIKMAFKLSHGENIKTEFNRLLALGISNLTGKTPLFSGEPDATVMVDTMSGDVRVTSSPLYVSGRYRKLKPGISQTRKRGADPLNSVEGMLCSLFVPLLKAEDVKFHGAGREDVDALMLGSGRPFVLEVVGPKKRRLSLRRAQGRFNARFGKTVSIRSLAPASRNSVVNLKMRGERRDKRYRVIVKVDRMPTEEKLREVESATTNLIMEQRTPKRVAWRRADKVRRRMIKSLKLKSIGDCRLEAIIETQAGAYVKEFITGDGGRTKPSLAELLNTPANWEALEVLQILGD